MVNTRRYLLIPDYSCFFFFVINLVCTYILVFQIDFLDLVDRDNNKLKQKISDSETKIQVRSKYYKYTV